jgi:hypothetical protein
VKLSGQLAAPNANEQLVAEELQLSIKSLGDFLFNTFLEHAICT